LLLISYFILVIGCKFKKKATKNKEKELKNENNPLFYKSETIKCAESRR